MKLYIFIDTHEYENIFAEYLKNTHWKFVKLMQSLKYSFKIRLFKVWQSSFLKVNALLSIHLILISLTSHQCPWTFYPANQHSQWTKEWCLQIWSPNPRECALLLQGEEENRVWSWDPAGRHSLLLGRWGRRRVARDGQETPGPGWWHLWKGVSHLSLHSPHLQHSDFPENSSKSHKGKRFHFAVGFFFFYSSLHIDLKEHSLGFQSSQTPLFWET